MRSLKFYFLGLAAVLVAGVALAGVDGPNIPSTEGKGIVVETNNTFSGTTSTGTFVVYVVTEETAVNETTGVAVDTGTEACAIWGADCVDVWLPDPAGGAGDELVDSTCATDQADQIDMLVFCS